MLPGVTISLWTGDTPLAWLIALMAGNFSRCRFFNACTFATKNTIKAGGSTTRAQNVDWMDGWMDGWVIPLRLL